MLPKLSRICFYVLALLLPIQGILASLITFKLGLPEWFNLWKEALVVIIVAELIFQILKRLLDLWKSYDSTAYLHENKSNKFLTFTNFLISKSTQLLPLLLIIAATSLVTLNSFLFGEFHSYIFLVGFRFELFWLWLFAILATFLNLHLDSLNFDRQLHIFLISLQKYISAGFILLVLFISLQYIFGSTKVLDYVGFGSNVTTTQKLVITAPTCHVVDFGEENCRLSGSFSSPNHLAGYLLLILAIFIVNLKNLLTQRSVKKHSLQIFLYLGAIILSLIFIFLSSARYAFLALFIWFVVTIIYFLPQIKNRLQKNLVALILLVPLLINLVFVTIGFTLDNPNIQIQNPYLPAFILKPSSTIEHYRNTLASLEILKEAPVKILTGLGLGNSGPAAKLEYQDIENQNLLFKQFSYLSYKWYIQPYRLTIPENWYIQVLLNGGLLYFICYFLLILYPLRGLYQYFVAKDQPSLSFQKLQISLAFFAILSGNLFLHLWENQTIALYWSILYIFLIGYSQDFFDSPAVPEGKSA